MSFSLMVQLPLWMVAGIDRRGPWAMFTRTR